MRATLGLLQNLTADPATASVADIEAVRAAGVPDAGIREAMYVCFCFNLIDRLADALDFTLPDRAGYEAGGRFLFKHGYGKGSIPG